MKKWNEYLQGRFNDLILNIVKPALSVIIRKQPVFVQKKGETFERFHLFY